MFNIYVIILLVLSACASKPSFQKNSNETIGYVIQNYATNDNFRVIVNLPQGTTEQYARNYGYRAVGEECLIRGFNFFDVGEVDGKVFEGFCFKDSVRKSLAVSFQNDGLVRSPKRFVIEYVNNKPSTKLKLNDELLLMDNKSPDSMANLKSLVFNAATNNKNFLPLKIRRKGRELKVMEPIADLKNGVLDINDLDALRTFVR